MEKKNLEGVEKANFFTVRLGNGNVYMAQVKDEKNIFKVGREEGKDVITSASLNDRHAIQLTHVFVIVPTKDGPLPVKYADMPGGSPVLWINTNQIAEYNVIDRGSKLIVALESIDSGVLIESQAPDLNKSSRGLVSK